MASGGWSHGTSTCACTEQELKAKVQDLVREHPEVIGEYGALLETWCRDIERYLEDGLDQHSAVQEPGPRSELDFWRGRMQKITSITEQLKGRECKSVFNVLHVRISILRFQKVLHEELSLAILVLSSGSLPCSR
eukprot:s629_g11.t1